MTYSVVDRMTEVGIRSAVMKAGKVVAIYQTRGQAASVAALMNASN